MTKQEELKKRLLEERSKKNAPPPKEYLQISDVIGTLEALQAKYGDLTVMAGPPGGLFYSVKKVFEYDPLGSPKPYFVVLLVNTEFAVT